jgi:hypothetical protein
MMLDAGYWILDVDAGYEIRDTGYVIRDIG